VRGGFVWLRRARSGRGRSSDGLGRGDSGAGD